MNEDKNKEAQNKSEGTKKEKYAARREHWRTIGNRLVMHAMHRN